MWAVTYESNLIVAEFLVVETNKYLQNNGNNPDNIKIPRFFLIKLLNHLRNNLRN